ncbi:hypothetical protein [Tautonia marina]|uniref:hypothetical protein n=1 Tax=Tautonia marina TaxID=2653855 RepID=UPI0012612E0C|nr:hypothetical protein [Tautonia marina]
MMRLVTRLLSVACVVGLAGNDSNAQAPITGIAVKMGRVVRDLEETQTGEPVQNRQQGILQDLDKLIAELEKECAACQNGMRRNNPTNPLADSTIGKGTGGIGDQTDPNASQKDWANLSARERDRILQSMSEGFPPEYRTVLERYYRRLAEETTTESTPTTAPTEGSPNTP